MDYPHHARLTLLGREGLAKSVVEGRLSLREAAAELGLSRQSPSKWVRRYREVGAEGLYDRSRRPRGSPRSTSKELIERVEQLRRERWTGVRIAQVTGLSRATVSRILTRLKLNKVKMLEPQVPVIRYEHDAPGDMLIATSRSSHASSRLATASPVILAMRPAEQAGSSSMSRSTTTRASLTPHSIRTKRPTPRRASWPKP
jgi:transposase